jgi:membrane protein implicated in regulation of membrane protease activity
MALAFWCILLLACLGVEFHTRAFIAIFLALGAVLGLIMAVAGVPFFFQALIWVAGSGAGIAALRPLALRRFQHHYEIDMSQPTQTALTHLPGLVEEVVGDQSHPGRVRIQGELWKAVTDWPEPIAIGTPVVVDRAYGTTLWVNPR